MFYQQIVGYFSKHPWQGGKVPERQLAWVSDKQFARRAAVKDVYYRVTCCGLRLSGQKRLAQKVCSGQIPSWVHVLKPKPRMSRCIALLLPFRQGLL